MAALSNNLVAQAIYLLAQEQNDTAEFSKRIVRFLAKKGLLSKAPDILSRLETIGDAEEGRVRAKVSSPEILNDATRKEITNALSKRYGGKAVILEEKVREELLGGYRIEIGDEVMDLSAKKRLEQLQEHLTKEA